jgi:serine/threonine-protein kinase
MLQPGDVVDETYVVECLLGSGGMAHVYGVKHLRMPRKFALKVLQIQAAVRGDFLERFEREAEILATLRHPHIVDVIDRNKLADGNPYIVMELLEGEDLATFIARSGALAVPVALRILSQIGEALDAAHRVGITHRDLKPSNIYLCKHGQVLNFVKVLDFGIAKMAVPDRAPMTAPADLMGTPGYMAPEQARGENNRIGPATDQFALAATLYEMLTGQGAFFRPGDSIYAILERVVFAKPEPLPYPQINLAVQKALSKAPEDRYPSLNAFLAAVGATSHTVYSTGGNPILQSSLTGLAGEQSLSRAAFKRSAIKALTAACAVTALLFTIKYTRTAARGAERSAIAKPERTPPPGAPVKGETPVLPQKPTPPTAPPNEVVNRERNVTTEPAPAQPVNPKPATPAVTGAPSETVTVSKPISSAAPHFWITGFASRSPAIRLIHSCAKAHLGRLSLGNGTVIRLERSGTLTVVSGPQAVLDSGLNDCLRQQLTTMPLSALPQTVHISITR